MLPFSLCLIFINIYFYYNIIKEKIILKNNVIKSNEVYNLSHEFTELNEAFINLIYYCLNIKKKFLNFLKSNYIFYWLSKLFLNPTSSLNYVKITIT
jgi:hypothetical protein